MKFQENDHDVTFNNNTLGDSIFLVLRFTIATNQIQHIFAKDTKQ